MSALENKEETLNKEVETNDVENSINVEASEADIEAFNKAVDIVNSLGLNWTFRSIELLTYNKKVTLNQLRACLFEIDGKPQYNVELACRYLIMAGLINKDNQSKIDELEDNAYDILDSWREKVGFIGVLHIIIINIMENKHFFMGETDVSLLSAIGSQKIQPETYSRLIAVDAETRLNQIKALM